MKSIQILKSIAFLTVFIFSQSYIIASPSLVYPTNSHEIIEKGGWEMLGTTTVKRGLDRDVINVTSAKGAFKKMKIKVKAAPLLMEKLVVHYENGTTQSVAIRYNFAPGSESRIIDLPGNNRAIRKVVFWYQKRVWGSNKPVVVLWGMH